MLRAFIYRPLVCCFIFWSLGIIFANYFRLTELNTKVLLCVSLLSFLIASFIRINEKDNNDYIKAGLLFVRLMPLAFISFCVNIPFFNPYKPGDEQYFAPTEDVVFTGYFVDIRESIGANSRWQGKFILISAFKNGKEIPLTDMTIFCRGYTENIPENDINLKLSGRISNYNVKRLPAYTFDSYLWNLQKGYDYSANIYSFSETANKKPTKTISVKILREVCHKRLNDGLNKLNVNPVYSAIIEGLVLGSSGANMSEDIIEVFRKSGTLHVMIVSGDKVTTFGLILILPLSILISYRGRMSYPKQRRVLMILSFPILLLYIFIADSGVSVTRALITFFIIAICTLITLYTDIPGRSLTSDNITTLAIAGFILLFLNPANLFSAGFQLSFIAVLGLITISPILFRFLYIAIKYRNISWLIAATVAAQILTTPILIWHFGAIPTFGIISNIITVPLTGIIFIFGIVLVFCTNFLIALTPFIAAIAVPLTKLTFSINAFFAHQSFSTVNLYIHSLFFYIIYFALVILLFTYLKKIPLLTIEKLDKLRTKNFYN